jgi:hypothetical protein
MAEIQTYPAKIFIFIPDPQSLLTAGYDSVRLERRKKPSEDFALVTKIDPVTVQAGVYNYFFLDELALKGWEYEPVLQNSAVPGTPVDVRFGITPAVDATFEKTLTVQELKDIYLYGLEDALSNDQGIPLPDRVYVHYIQAAIAKFEQKVQVRVCPKRFVEKHDWFREDAETFMFFLTDEFPILNDEDDATTLPVVELMLPGQVAQAFPASWLQLQEDFGQLHLVPDSSSGISFSGTQAANALRGLRSSKFIPNAFRLTYFAGFGADNPLPLNIKDVIGKEASFGPLNIGGDLLGGAGIASQSISLDSLSQSFNTTSSATNAGFGARIIQYTKELKDQYPELIRTYKGLRMRVA